MSAVAKVGIRKPSLTASANNVKNHLLVLGEKSIFSRPQAWTVLKQVFPAPAKGQLEALEKANFNEFYSFTYGSSGGEPVVSSDGASAEDEPATASEAFNSVTIYPLPGEKSRNLGFIRSDKIPEASSLKTVNLM